MPAIYPRGWVAALFVLAVAGPASAQSLRWPSYPAAYPVYARVTITNQTDIAIVFRSQWGNEEPRREVLEPGRAVTLETTFAAGTPKPELTVVYRTGSWHRRPEVVSLPSGHVDPGTDNPGRVYDFYRQRSNVGPIVTLTAR
jgi:hypothetical protein